MIKTWSIPKDKLDEFLASIDNVLSGEELTNYTLYDDDEDEDDDDDDVIKYGNTAIVRLSGVLMCDPNIIESLAGAVDVSNLRQVIKELKEDSNIENVIFHVNSYGGEVTGIPELAKLIREISNVKNVIGYTDRAATSAAYWLLSQMPAVYASETASVGGVGVYTLVQDLTQHLAKEGIKIIPFYRGKYKLMGAPFKELSDEEKQMIQKLVDADYEAFKTAVKDIRDIKDEDLEGQVYRGQEALGKGFIDGFMDDIREVIDKVI
jgi:protease-4